jgi:SET domain-containing protein
MIAKNREEGAESMFIGAGIYPTLAMFNHSCDPSIVRFYIEDAVCVQSIKNIRKGEEICENYGPIFFHSNREDRQVTFTK